MLNTSSKKTDLPLLVGITGGIGSGKSLICSVFRILGIPVFEADKAAREITGQNPDVKKELSAYFGPDIYKMEDGSLNRKKLASLIFNNPESLSYVNRLVHPLVKENFDRWVREQKAAYILQEAAILFESGFYRFMDLNILITAPVELRVRRVMERDHTTREQIMERMKNQWNDEEKSRFADFVIINDEVHPVIDQVLNIDKKIRIHGKIC
jgi:dephospho-CoA kinase